MKRKQLIAGILIVLLALINTSCAPLKKEPSVQPSTTQLKSICELSVMECYYHNVAKFDQANAEGILFWTKDKKFWVEYSGTVKVGIDASKVSMEINGDSITITIPEAKVLSSKVESSSLNKESYIVAKDSAAITAEDEVEAFKVAQKEMEESASNDKTLLGMAQQRAQQLLEDYVINIGNAVGKSYSIKWNYIESEKEE